MEHCLLDPEDEEQEEVSDAKTWLAVKLRRRLRGGQDEILIKSNNPRLVLNAFRRTDLARELLKEGLEDLLRRAKKGNQVCAAIATFYFELGMLDKADIYSDKSCGALARSLEAKSHKDFLATLCTLDEETRERLWFREKVKIAGEKADIPGALPSSTNFAEVERIHCDQLSVAEFRSSYVAKGRPVVITGLLNKLIDDGDTWDLDFLDKVAGHRKAPLKRREANSTEWARLEKVSENMDVGDFVQGLRSGAESVRGLYLFDWSLPLFCPELAGRFRIPEYFSHDYLKTTSSSALYRESWPSLFVTGAGVSSDLHVDTNSTHFWMVLIHGQKRWKIFSRDQRLLLSPRYDESLDPVFDEDPIRDPEALADKGLIPTEVLLCGGDVIFVPQGSPHSVENLSEVSVAISGNFVDATNVGEVAQSLRKNALVDERAASLLGEFALKGYV